MRVAVVQDKKTRAIRIIRVATLIDYLKGAAVLVIVGIIVFCANHFR